MFLLLSSLLVVALLLTRWLQEVYTTEHWLVRIYKVKQPENIIEGPAPHHTKPVRPPLAGKGRKGYMRDKVTRKRVGGGKAGAGDKGGTVE